MTELYDVLTEGRIPSYDEEIYKKIKDNWDRISKPIDSMGAFEDIISRIGAIQGRIDPGVRKNAVLVFAADNGIVEEGVSQSGQEITAICADGIADMRRSVSVMAESLSVDVKVIDVGVAKELTSPNIIREKIRRGSRSFLHEPAMTGEETMRALNAGYKRVKECADSGYDLVGIGEIGIGNTTTASAVTTALLNLPAEAVTGRGAGLNDEGLRRKIGIIDRCVKKYGLGGDPLRVLETVGGYDIAAMAGACIGGAVCKIPVILDGFISNVAALVSERLVEGTGKYLIASHLSGERAAGIILNELGLEPVINARMALGEGTGAVMMMGLIKTADAVYEHCNTFTQDGIEQYRRL